ncbi:MAG: ATP-binding protein, partial [Candidatus Atribacteria bacterium]|nr:ATP-binding protein [Candidatus Atribacteria bacterium]
RKCYIIDHGLRLVYGFRFSNDRGKILENAVFLELRHRKAKNPLLEIFYWKDLHGYEVDFVVTEGTKVQALIQASADITHPKTREREIRALLAASRDLQCDNLTILTFDVESSETVENRKILYQPFWKWALEL